MKPGRDIYALLAKRAKCSRSTAKQIVFPYFYQRDSVTVWQMLKHIRVLKDLFEERGP